MENEKLKEMLAQTMYLDLSLPIEQVVILFIAQVCVFWFYLTSILGNFDFVHANYAFWLVAYLAMQMTMIFNRGADSALGNPFPIHDVFRIVTTAGQVTYTLEDHDEATPFTVTR